MDRLKNLILIMVLMLLNQSKKLTVEQKSSKLKRKYLIVIKNITTKDFNGKIFDERLKQAKLAAKAI